MTAADDMTDMMAMADILDRTGSGEDPISVKLRDRKGWWDTTPSDLSYDLPTTPASEFIVSYRVSGRDVKRGSFRGMLRDRINSMIENGGHDATIGRGLYAEYFLEETQ